MFLNLTAIQYDILNEYRQRGDRPIPFDSLDKLMLAQKRLVGTFDRTILKWCSDGSIPSTGCLSETTCSQKLFASYRRMISDNDTITWLLNRLGHHVCTQMDLCPSCEAEAVKQYSQGRKSAWEELPILFGVDGCWDTGNDMSSDSDSE